MTTAGLCADRKRAAPTRRSRGFRVLWAAAALAGTAAVVAAAACGVTGTLAPGQPGGMAVRAACARPAAPLSAGQLRAAYQAPPLSAGALTGAGTVMAVIIPSAAPHVAADLAVYSRRAASPAAARPVLRARPGPDRHGRGRLGAGGHPGPGDGARARPRSAAGLPGRPARRRRRDRPGRRGAGLAGHPLPHHGGVLLRGHPGGLGRGPQGYKLITSSRAGLEAAARAGVTVVASSGDYGPAKPGPGGHLERAVAWPASDPLATAVGGTRLTAVTAAGHTPYASTAFSYTSLRSGGRAGGAGLSAVFARPPWQDSVAAVTGTRRGIADISMDASDCSPVAAYTSTNDLPGQRPGWIYVSGTSVAAPLFAAAVADAAQAARHPLGVLGPALYQLHGDGDGIADVTSGSNTMPGLPGYAARPGYDLPTGIGTVSSITLFSRALARTARARQTTPPATG